MFGFTSFYTRKLDIHTGTSPLSHVRVSNMIIFVTSASVATIKLDGSFWLINGRLAPGTREKFC